MSVRNLLGLPDTKHSIKELLHGKQEQDVRNFATPASRVIGREVRVLFLAQSPAPTVDDDVIAEAAQSDRRMGVWLGSSGLMDDSNYFCFFETISRKAGRRPKIEALNPSHVWAAVIECDPDVIVACGGYVKKFLEVYMPQENILEWYNPDGRNRKESPLSDVHLAWALGHEVDWKVEAFFEDAELINRRRTAREVFGQALRDAGLLE